MTGAILGNRCPNCGRCPAIRVGDTAFCANEECPLLCWIPSMTRAEFDALPVQIVNLVEGRNDA